MCGDTYYAFHIYSLHSAWVIYANIGVISQSKDTNRSLIVIRYTQTVRDYELYRCHISYFTTLCHFTRAWSDQNLPIDRYAVTH